MTLRRKLLLASASALGLANVAYIAWLRLWTGDELKAEWVAYMPDLEKKQRKYPYNLLNSSDGHDPDYPILYVYEGDETYPLFSKIADDCKINAYIIDQHIGPTKTTAAIEMPDRLFVGALSREMVSCLNRKLPKGYTLARLKGRVSPLRIGWGENDLPLRPF